MCFIELHRGQSCFSNVDFVNCRCDVTVCVLLQAVEELLESLELEKSSYHMGLSRVSTQIHTHTVHILQFVLSHVKHQGMQVSQIFIMYNLVRALFLS